MKRVIINSKQVGLVYKRKEFQRMLNQGSHWLGFGEDVIVFDKNIIYNSLEDMAVISADTQYSELTQAFQIKHNEVGLVFKNNQFEIVLATGNYFYFKGLHNIKVDIYNLDSPEITDQIERSILTKVEFAYLVKTVKVENFETGLLIIDGKFVRELSSGTYFFWNANKSVEVLKVDTRSSQIEISGQELLTKDKAALRINFQLEYRVENCQKALLENKDFVKQLYTKAQLALREIVGAYTLDELIAGKEKINEYVSEKLKTSAADLGVSTSNAGIRDIILPGEMKDIMNQVLVAEKQAQVNVIVRREETASTRSMLNTAKLMEENAILYKLKEMEFAEKIANKIGEFKLSNSAGILDQINNLISK